MGLFCFHNRCCLNRRRLFFLLLERRRKSFKKQDAKTNDAANSSIYEQEKLVENWWWWFGALNTITSSFVVCFPTTNQLEMPKEESSLLLLSPANQTALKMLNIVPILPSIFVQQVQFQQTFFSIYFSSWRTSKNCNWRHILTKMFECMVYLEGPDTIFKPLQWLS